jgi:hypothetical protein
MHLPAHTETVLLYPWRWQVCSLIWNTCPRVTEMHPVPLELFSTISLLLFLGPTWRRPICGSEMFPFGTQCPMTYRTKYNQSPLQWPRGLRHTLLLRSSTGIVGSNPSRKSDVSAFFLCARVVLCIGSGLAWGWSPVQGVLPIVYRLKTLKREPPWL